MYAINPVTVRSAWLWHSDEDHSYNPFCPGAPSTEAPYYTSTPGTLPTDSSYYTAAGCPGNAEETVKKHHVHDTSEAGAAPVYDETQRGAVEQVTGPHWPCHGINIFLPEQAITTFDTTSRKHRTCSKKLRHQGGIPNIFHSWSTLMRGLSSYPLLMLLLPVTEAVNPNRNLSNQQPLTEQLLGLVTSQVFTFCLTLTLVVVYCAVQAENWHTSLAAKWASFVGLTSSYVYFIVLHCRRLGLRAATSQVSTTDLLTSPASYFLRTLLGALSGLAYLLHQNSGNIPVSQVVRWMPFWATLSALVNSMVLPQLGLQQEAGGGLEAIAGNILPLVENINGFSNSDSGDGGERQV